MNEQIEVMVKNVAYFRKARGITQAELARSMGVKQNTVAHWEIGMSSPRLNGFVKLATLLGVKLEDFLRVPDEETIANLSKGTCRIERITTRKLDKKIVPEIKRRRLLIGMTQRELSEKIGVAMFTVSRWECGKGAPSEDLLPKLADALGCTEADLLSPDSNAEQPKVEKVYKKKKEKIMT